MKFDKILDNNTLWAVRYDGAEDNASWLRIYAIKLEPGCYIITGGAIKLTRTMQERAHTLAELNKMEQVRNFLLNGGAIDTEGFVDYLSEIQ